MGNRYPVLATSVQDSGGWVRGPTSTVFNFNAWTSTHASLRTRGSSLEVGGSQPQLPMRIVWNTSPLRSVKSES